MCFSLSFSDVFSNINTFLHTQFSPLLSNGACAQGRSATCIGKLQNGKVSGKWGSFVGLSKRLAQFTLHNLCWKISAGKFTLKWITTFQWAQSHVAHVKVMILSVAVLDYLNKPVEYDTSQADFAQHCYKKSTQWLTALLWWICWIGKRATRHSLCVWEIWSGHLW